MVILVDLLGVLDSNQIWFGLKEEMVLHIHVLQDSVRGFGPTYKLSSSSTQHENDTNSGGSYGITDPQWGYLTSVDEGGFSLSDTELLIK